MPYTSEKYEFLFDNNEELTEAAFERLRHRDVFRYRAKTIKSGDVLEVEVFPIWATQTEVKKAHSGSTRQAQRNLNEKNAKKRIIRKINANFAENDLAVTLTYKNFVPDQEQARRDIQNYLRRVRAYRRKNGLPELKYVYVIEFTGDQGRTKKRVHHHVIMSGMDRDIAEGLWGSGWVNTKRLQPDEYGLEAITRYMVKEPNGGKRWCASRNLKEPQETKADTKISKRRVQEMATDFDNAPAAIFGKLFPDYEFNDCDVRHSDFVAGAYIYARLHRKKDKPPKRSRKRGDDNCLK
ncbi:hypothetical protein UNSWDHB_2668 [Dehalobacter sp. UNSWDHB]|uniref:rolling circle replication-associated protein n=1 Tax=Dehalobacter sp. UNSWDHB TaxID=1339256 RepID=UPI000387588A|nr:hypothetical protein [Dehalobacter sp. UNSWDHB]EQB20082.1 hypothetical protein UNSWDHB_2668 [Dehalobacter sp. UNSWDHB]